MSTTAERTVDRPPSHRTGSPMNIVVRRRLATGALLASSALVAGVLLAPASSAANGLTITPSAAPTNESTDLTFKSTDPNFDLEFGGTAHLSRIGGGTPLDVSINPPVPPGGPTAEATTPVDFTDMGDGVGQDGPADAGTYNVAVDG